MKKGIVMVMALLALLVVSCSTKDSVDYRDLFTGNYNATNSVYNQDSIQLLNKYTLTITKSSDVSKEILLSNFTGDSITIKALVTGSNFTIVPDTINKNVYSGTGTISNSNLSINIWIKSIQNDGYTNYIDTAVKN